MGRCGPDASGSGHGPMAGCHEHGNEPSGPTKGGQPPLNRATATFPGRTLLLAVIVRQRWVRSGDPPFGSRTRLCPTINTLLWHRRLTTWPYMAVWITQSTALWDDVGRLAHLYNKVVLGFISTAQRRHIGKCRHSPTLQPPHPRGKNPWYPLDMRLSGSQSRSDAPVRIKNTPSLSLPATESQPSKNDKNVHSTQPFNFLTDLN